MLSSILYGHKSKPRFAKDGIIKMNIFWDKMNKGKDSSVISVLGGAILLILLLSGCSNSDNEPKFAMEVKMLDDLSIKPGSQEFRIRLYDVKIAALSKGNDKQMEQIKKVYEITEGNRCFLEGKVTALKDITKSQIVKLEPTKLVCAVKDELKSIAFAAKEEYYKGTLVRTDQHGFGSLSQHTMYDLEMLTRDIMSSVAVYIAEEVVNFATFGIPNTMSKVHNILSFEKTLAEEKGVVDILKTKDLVIGLDNAPMKFKIKTLSEIGEVVTLREARAVLDNYESEKIQRNNIPSNSIDRFADDSTNSRINGNLARGIYSQDATIPVNIPLRMGQKSYKENSILKILQ